MQFRAGWKAGVAGFSAPLAADQALTLSAATDVASELDLRSGPSLSLDAATGCTFGVLSFSDLTMRLACGGEPGDILLAKDYDRGGW